MQFGLENGLHLPIDLIKAMTKTAVGSGLLPGRRRVLFVMAIMILAISGCAAQGNDSSGPAVDAGIRLRMPAPACRRRLFRQNRIKGVRIETGVGMTPMCKKRSFRQMASIIS